MDYVRITEDYGKEHLIPNLKNIYTLLNMIGKLYSQDEYRVQLCFLLRMKLIDELKDTLSSYDLAIVIDEQRPFEWQYRRP